MVPPVTSAQDERRMKKKEALSMPTPPPARVCALRKEGTLPYTFQLRFKGVPPLHGAIQVRRQVGRIASHGNPLPRPTEFRFASSRTHISAARPWLAPAAWISIRGPGTLPFPFMFQCQTPFSQILTVALAAKLQRLHASAASKRNNAKQAKHRRSCGCGDDEALIHKVARLSDFKRAEWGGDCEPC
jgi:hypothetical protein